MASGPTEHIGCSACWMATAGMRAATGDPTVLSTCTQHGPKNDVPGEGDQPDEGQGPSPGTSHNPAPADAT